MHKWHTETGTDIMKLIDDFEDFQFNNDNGPNVVDRINVTNKMFKTEEEARTFVTNSSYGSCVAYLAAFARTAKPLSKAYQNAFKNFQEKRKEYRNYFDNLNIGFGRKSEKVTCPDCGSSISLKYGKHYKYCPVCGSMEIISDSNWKTFKTKKKLMIKASETLAREAEKYGIAFVCGIEWHC